MNRNKRKSMNTVKTADNGKLIKWLSFLIPAAVIFLVCAVKKVYPFGEECVLHVDMYHQYAPFFSEFLKKLQSGGSLFYSWDLGLGSDFVAVYAYYLASPMNWLLVLCPRAHLIEFMTLLIFIKTGLCGFSFAVFLSGHFKSKNICIVYPAVFYALSAFVCAYYWNIMWLDCIWLAPLIVLGLEQLIRDGKCGLYCVCLAVSIWSNYYISIMICLFLVIWYFMHVGQLAEKGKRLKSFFRFAIYSVLSAGISAMILIPEIKMLGYSGSSEISLPESLEWYFNIFGELARHCVDVAVTTTEGDWPNIYCGVAVLFFVTLYALNRKIRLTDKIKYFLLLAFFLVSFSCNYLDYIWHGFHFPDGLPARESFLYIFVLLMMCTEALLQWEGNRLWNLAAGLAVSVGLLVGFALFTDTELVTPWAIVITGLFILCYAFLFYISCSKDPAMRQTACILAFAVVIAETFLNMNATGIDVTSRTAYTKNLEGYRTLTESVKETDDSFYRTEKFARMTKNESSLSGYASASLFSSLLNINVADAYKEVGMEGGKNFYCYNGATPVISSMLGVKYMLTDSGEEESPLRTLIDSFEDVYLYQNTYALPLGFMVDSELEENWDYENLSNVQAVNRLGQLLGAQEDTLTPFTGTQVSAGDTVITVTEDCYVYASYSDKSLSTITEEVNGRKRTFTKCSHLYLLDLGWCTAGTEIHLTSPQTEFLDVIPYKLNLDSVDTAYNTLSGTTMDLEDWSDTEISGTVSVETAGDLVISVPKEEGWTVYVDGEKTENTGYFMGAFFSIPLDEGTHTIYMTYETPGFRTGAVISAVSLALLAASFAIKKKKRMAAGTKR